MSTNEGDARSQGSRGPSWVRRYPPLIVIGLALVLVLAVMPSALNLPQSNPSEVPEYAPVPPEDDTPPPESSNLQALRLGEPAGVIEEVSVPPPPADPGVGADPTIYNCVAAQQTEDPLSPPCSPFFTGDNGGATYHGVTKDEVRVLVYMDGSITETTGSATYDGERAPLQGTYCDGDAEPNSQKECHNTTDVDHLYVRIMRAFSRYFNFRYQTYGRHLHFYLYWSGATDAGGRRADAAENIAEINPFAVIDLATFRGNNAAYIDAMARDGVLVFSSLQAQPRSFYRQYDPLVWTFWPDIEQQVEHYTEFICKKVAPYPVAHSGPGIAAGQPRKYAFMHTTDPAWPGLHHFRDLVRPRLEEQCGVTPEIEVVFPFAGYVVDTGGDPAYARLNVARMRENKVTTILWFGGVEGKTSQAADEQKYYPEIFYAGDTNMESQNNGLLQNRNFWEHAAIVSNMLREDQLENSLGYQAWREAEPNAPTDPDGFWASLIYRDFFMVAMGVQVAGPRLHPVTVNEGFRAIPTITSTSPYLPACFFTQGNFCVQDASQWWWDPEGQAPGRRPDGCYRLVRGGQRFILGQWPKGDEVFVNGTDDPCSGFNGGFQLVVRGPGLGS